MPAARRATTGTGAAATLKCGTKPRHFRRHRKKPAKSKARLTCGETEDRRDDQFKANSRGMRPSILIDNLWRIVIDHEDKLDDRRSAAAHSSQREALGLTSAGLRKGVALPGSGGGARADAPGDAQGERAGVRGESACRASMMRWRASTAAYSRPRRRALRPAPCFTQMAYGGSPLAVLGRAKFLSLAVPTRPQLAASWSSRAEEPSSGVRAATAAIGSMRMTEGQDGGRGGPQPRGGRSALVTEKGQCKTRIYAAAALAVVEAAGASPRLDETP